MKTRFDARDLSRMTAGAAFMGMLAWGGACPAAEVYFQPANGNWDVASNWSANRVPTSAFSDTAAVGSIANVTTIVAAQPSGIWVRYGGGVLNIASTGSLTVNGEAYIGQGGSSYGTLNMLGGSLSATNVQFSNQPNCWGYAYQTSGSVTASGDLSINSGSGTNRSEYWLSGGTVSARGFRVGFALFDQSGGTLTLANGEKYIAQYSGPGVYNLSNGTLNMGTGIFYVGLNGTGTFNMSGGSVTAPTLAIGGHTNGTDGSGAGAFNVTNGTLTASNLQVGDTGATPQGTGLLKITGSSASPITVTGSGAAFTMGTNATLNAVIDSSGAITPINVTNSATLAGTLDMGLLGFTPNNPQTFDLLNTVNGTITNNGLRITWAGLNQAWQYSIVNSNKTLRVMYLPEPGTLALLALGGLGLLRRRPR